MINKEEKKEELDKYYCPGTKNDKRCKNILLVSEQCKFCGFYIGNYPGDINELLKKNGIKEVQKFEEIKKKSDKN